MIIAALNPDSRLPLNAYVSKLAFGAVAYAVVVNAPVYNAFANTLMLNLGTEISGVISNGNVAATGDTFGHLWTKAYVAALAVFKTLGWGPQSLGLSLVVVLYWVVSRR